MHNGTHIPYDDYTFEQSLINVNHQLISEPPNPQANVPPWMNTTIGPNLPRRPIESPPQAIRSW